MGKTRVRFAVVGQGYFAQAAVLPAFRHAKKSAELVAVVSDDAEKRQRLARRYKVDHAVGYPQYDELLASGEVDAVYLTVPNHLHREMTERAARHGVHVLCEKPMAPTEEDCEAMMAACKAGDCRLMIGYRLHFEPANLRAVEAVRSGKLGEPRSFSSTFSFQVAAPNIRLNPREQGGGPLFDTGIYCINAARCLFASEPTEVAAIAANCGDERFGSVEEQVSAVMRFPNERLACFTVGFDAARVSELSVVGDGGWLRLESPYEYQGEKRLQVTVGDKTRVKEFEAHDQIGPEIAYFAECILEGKEPEPSGTEGLADVRVIRALYRAIDSRQTISLGGFEKSARPTREQERVAPPLRREPPIFHAEPETRI